MQTVLSPLQYMESIRAIIRVVSMHEKEIMQMSDENSFTLAFLKSQIDHNEVNQFDDHNKNILTIESDDHSNNNSNNKNNSIKGKEINVLDGSIFNDEIAQNIESESIIDILNISMTSSVDVNEEDDDYNDINNQSLIEDETNVVLSENYTGEIDLDVKNSVSKDKKKKKDKTKKRKTLDLKSQSVESTVSENFEIDNNNNNDNSNQDNVEVSMDTNNEEAWLLDDFQFAQDDNDESITSPTKVKRRVSFSNKLVSEKIIHKHLPVICDGNIKLINQYKNSNNNNNNRRRNSTPNKRSRRSGF